MNRSSPSRRSLYRGLEFALVIAVLLLLARVLQAQPTAPAHGPLALPIANANFAASGNAEAPVRDWIFEAVKLELNEEKTGAKLKVTPEGEALARIPDDGKGVILEGTTETARGDLVSGPLKIAPFRLVDVNVDYAFESGEPLLFVCLRPTEDRGMVDLGFLPRGELGARGGAFVRLHSGSFDGDYSLSVSIGGIGTARIYSIEAREAGDYPRPDKPVFVVDLLRDNPRPDGQLAWGDSEKFVKLFGFSSVEHAHFSELTPEKLKAADPALIILSPKGRDLKRPDRGKLITAMNAVMDHEAPTVGICAGHQMLAMSVGKGAQMVSNVETTPDGGRKVLTEWGPTRLNIVKNDPVFEGFPRYPYFYASESHRVNISETFTGAEVLASTDFCSTQVFKYPGKPWYTFQCHIERDWEYACPESYLFWKNMLKMWKLAP